MFSLLQRHLSCLLLSALVTEYSSASGSSSIGLPVEFHFRCKKAIEVSVSMNVCVCVLLCQLVVSGIVGASNDTCNRCLLEGSVYILYFCIVARASSCFVCCI